MHQYTLTVKTGGFAYFITPDGPQSYKLDNMFHYFKLEELTEAIKFFEYNRYTDFQIHRFWVN